jgi:hypothetical protein
VAVDGHRERRREVLPRASDVADELEREVRRIEAEELALLRDDVDERGVGAGAIGAIDPGRTTRAGAVLAEQSCAAAARGARAAEEQREPERANADPRRVLGTRS